jgi:glycosyltransferase involved in cell wall biosynthesis
MKSVLYVSKPIVPPFHDGSKNLVRDLAETISWRATVMGQHGVDATLSSRVHVAPVYHASVGFAPGLRSNFEALRAVLRTRDIDLWHFVFAPSPKTAVVANLLRTLKRLPLLQTVASAPAKFVRPGLLGRLSPSLWFGDVVVVHSEHTRARTRRSDVHVIYPCAREVIPRGHNELALALEKYGLRGEPFVLFPGDYEVSLGAARTLAAVQDFAAEGIRTVFACRPKTVHAAKKKQSLVDSAKGFGLSLEKSPLFLDTVDMHALLQACVGVVFPVDDLFGKVDLPLVLLEALSLGKPVITTGEGPLVELLGASIAQPNAPTDLVAQLLQETRAGEEAVARRKELYRSWYHPRVTVAAYERLYKSFG